jgi:hypothetical protein
MGFMARVGIGAFPFAAVQGREGSARRERNSGCPGPEGPVPGASGLQAAVASRGRDGRYLRHHMKPYLPLLAALALLSEAPSYAQGSLQDTSITVVPITLSYAYQLPGGALDVQFGANHNIGLSASVKFKSNYMLGLEGAFIFGNNVKDKSMLRNLATANGVVVNQDGDPATILLYERGYSILAFAGKVVPIAGPNPNSGILLKLGGGYLRHRVLIESQNDVVPALEGDYLKGYDRLRAGPMAMAFVGYQHLGNNRFINFVVGFEMNLAFTKAMRPYQFDTGATDSETEIEGLNGLRFGWTLPLYKARDNRQFYY